MFSKLPRKWKIGSYTFEIRVVDGSDERLLGNDGLTVFSEQVIYLDDSMKTHRAAVVVLHEAVHVINWVFGVTDESDEETVTTQVSSGLMTFWNHNPRVMTWLNRTRRSN